MGDCTLLTPTRRAILGATGALFAWSFIPRVASAAGARDARFLTVVLRGGLDGLSAVAPVADPDYTALREGIALAAEGEHAGHALDGFFVLHPAMPNLARLYRAGQATIVHAVATGYRERSHFDGQDVLESGQPRPGLVGSGWVNRLASVLEPMDRVSPRGVLGVGQIPPLIVRGPAPVLGWAPQVLPDADDDFTARLHDLYAGTDPMFAEALGRHLETERIAASGPATKRRNGFTEAAAGAARLVAADDGPRLAALALDGFDTHANEGGANGRLAKLLGTLDEGIGVLEAGLGARWRDTAILFVTEFGRTARVNGTVGTDHGTATVAMLVGGAVNGGRVLADWPGLRAADLHEGRDLRPTADLRAVAKGIAADLFEVSEARLGDEVFPGTAGLAPYRDLVAPAA